ncbi:hypothetical protein [Galbibacter sp. BG1]
MKIKTIKKIIQAKIEKWADSVSDPDIKKIIKENTIITGGSIASMLLNEPVNDFDVYLDSKEAAKKISNHYTKSNNEVLVIDGSDYKNFDYYNDSCLESIEYNHQLGRCVHNLDEDRIKLYIPEKGILKVDIPEEDQSADKFIPSFFTSNAITLTDDLQIVIRFHGKAEDIHENYDFVHATNYYISKTNKLVLREEALTSLLTKDLQYIGSKYPLTSVIRSKKFILRGFTCGAGTYLKMLYQVSLLNLNDITVLEDQLAGVDVAYFEVLLDALNNMKKRDEKLNYGYLSTLIDRIFNEE